MNVTIQITDEQAMALKAKAAQQGLTLETWFQKLAAVEAPTGTPRPRRSRYLLSELMEQCDSAAPMQDEDRAWLNAQPVGREFL